MTLAECKTLGLEVHFLPTTEQAVAFAEQLAKHLSGRKDVRVLVRHLELEKIGK